MDIEFMGRILPEMLRAARVTVEISALALVLGTALGILLGSLRTLGPAWLKVAIQAVVDFIRGLPPLVPIAFIYFALPGFGLTLSEFWTGVVALVRHFTLRLTMDRRRLMKVGNKTGRDISVEGRLNFPVSFPRRRESRRNPNAILT